MLPDPGPKPMQIVAALFSFDRKELDNRDTEGSINCE